MSIDPLERGLEQSFETEKWGRFIRECDDLETLREASLSLLQQLAQLKAASSWMASRASGVSSSGWLVWMTTKTAARRRSNGASV